MSEPFHRYTRLYSIDLRTLARHFLDLNRRNARHLTPPQNFDAYTFAHLTEAKVRIEKALEAGLELEK